MTIENYVVNRAEQNYLDLLCRIVEEGEIRSDRTGVGTSSIFGTSMKFDLYRDGFPLLTTKKVNFKSIAGELFWFLSGSTNVKDLHAHGIHIWDEWADEKGELGPIYGRQWRRWRGTDDGYNINTEIDQIFNVVESIKSNPFSRRHVVSAWNPAEIDEMALPPCHTMFQFNVRGDSSGKPKFLDCQLYQRSGDMFLGVPYNIASYSLLTHMIAHITGLNPGVFTHVLGDAHVYLNHYEAVSIQLGRIPKAFPSLHIGPTAMPPNFMVIDDIKMDDILLTDYDPYPAISAPIAV